MIDQPGSLPILGRGGQPDPNLPTLHTCADCGFQLLIPAGLVELAAQHHRRGCLGPKLANIAERLTQINAAILVTRVEDD